MSFPTHLLEAAHKHCTRNRVEIEASDLCACFYCEATFPASEVTEWIDDEGGNTALCPHCPVDSVIGSASGLPIADPSFVSAMHEYWFERTADVAN